MNNGAITTRTSVELRKRPSRLWILNHYAAVPGEPTGTRHYDLAHELLRQGWQTTIFAASNTHLCPPRPVAAGRWRDEEVDGVHFVWIKTKPCGHSRAKRILNEVQYARCCLVAGAGRPVPRIIIGSSAHLFAGLAACRAAKILGTRFVFEVRDLWPETLVQLGKMSRSHPFVVALAKIERYLYREADQIITLLPGAAPYITAAGGARQKIVHIPNGVALNRLSAVADHPVSDALRRLKREHGFVVAYAGAHGRANALDTLLQAALLLRQRGQLGLAFALIGDGREKETLVRFAREHGLANVAFFAPVSKKAVHSVLSEADAFYLGWRHSPLYKFGVSPNKLTDYFAAARPIIHAIDCPYDIVRDSGAGVSIPPERPSVLADALLAVRGMTRSERVALGRRGRRYAEANLAMSHLADRLVAEVLTSDAA